MATKPKKSASTSKKNVKRKSTPKKTKKKSPLKKDIFIVVTMLVLISLVAFGYFLGKSETLEKRPVNKQTTASTYSTKQLLDDLGQIELKSTKEDTLQKNEQLPKKEKLVKKEVDTKPPMKERGIEKKQKPLKEVNKQKQEVTLAYRGKKPRLVIIIDDVHTQKQIQSINKLGMKVTPSIFPPYALSKKSHLLVSQAKHYMIHLPMESGSKQFNKQAKTLLTTFSDEQIVDRVMEIRKLFPNAKYINNHTGSVFTSHYKAMKKLYIALKLEGFVFVDSFTAGTSKVGKIAHEFGDAYVRRDVFIDNTHTVESIHKQLKLAVKKAHKNGYAVAIGHPHKTTMKALTSAKHILQDIELVYIDDIYRKRK